MPAPDTAKRLVDRFDQDRKVFLSGDYKEEQLRAEFLNPFFESLGWDIGQQTGPVGGTRQAAASRLVVRHRLIDDEKGI